MPQFARRFAQSIPSLFEFLSQPSDVALGVRYQLVFTTYLPIYLSIQSVPDTRNEMLHSARQLVGLRDATTSASSNPNDDAPLQRKQLPTQWGNSTNAAVVVNGPTRPSTSMDTPTSQRKGAHHIRPQLHHHQLLSQQNPQTPTPNHAHQQQHHASETPQTVMRPATGSMISTPRTAVRAQNQQHCSTTPSKSLFASPTSIHAPLQEKQQRFLLRELEPGQPKPLLTVVFDLDETLVSNRRADLTQAILRPYALHVLNALRHMAHLEVVMWTASTRETGAPVVEQLSMGGLVFDDVVFRSDAWFTEPIHTKDLRLLGRDLDRVVIFDNAPSCCKLNPHNSVIVEDFHGMRTENDAALVNCYYMIESLLKQAAEGVSVRDGLNRLLAEGHLCRPIFYQLPDAWSKVTLRDVPPIRIPPHGKYVRAHTLPPNAQTMKHWTI